MGIERQGWKGGLIAAIMAPGIALSAASDMTFGVKAQSGGGTQRHDTLYHRVRVEAALKGGVHDALPLSYKLEGAALYTFVEKNRDAAYGEVQPHNAYLELQQESWQVRLGPQTIAWGELVGPSIVDLVNPRDLREPAQFIKNENKLASMMLSLAWSHPEFGTVDAHLLPYASVPLMPRELSGMRVLKPVASKRTEWALRWGKLLAGWDLKLLTVTHASRLPRLTPAFDADGMLPVLKAQVDGMRSSGFTASYAFDQVVLRSEGLMTSPLESKGEQASLRQLVMAADITYEQLLLGLQEQYVDSSVHQGEEHRTTQNWWGVYGQYNFSALNITLQGLIYRKLAGQDQFHREGVQFALGDNGRLSLVHEGFAGEKEPLLNLLEHEDRISGEVSFVF